MVENTKIASKLGYLDTPKNLTVSLEQALKMPPSKVALICTGTQGEPSSILGRLSTDSNRRFNVQPGDTIILSSHPIPGNEEMIHRTINRLFQRGADVIYDAIAPVHVSGHASQEEIKFLLQLVKPKYLIPIHGELRHLKQHAALAREVGIPAENIAVVENGTLIEFQDGKMMVGDRIPGGYVFVDGSVVGDVGTRVLRERESLARDGFVIVHLVFDSKTHTVKGKPEIISKGFVFVPEATELFDYARDLVRKLASDPDQKDMKNRIEKELSKMFYVETKRRPLVLVLSSETR
jgi:ribonuclease J